MNIKASSPTTLRRLLVRGLIDEVGLHIAPVLPHDGIRRFDNPGGAPVRLVVLTGPDHRAAVDVRYRPATAGRPPHTRAAPEINRTHVQPLRPSAGLLIADQP